MILLENLVCFQQYSSRHRKAIRQLRAPSLVDSSGLVPLLLLPAPRQAGKACSTSCVLFSYSCKNSFDLTAESFWYQLKSLTIPEAIRHPTREIEHAPSCPCVIGLRRTRSGSPLTSSIPLPVIEAVGCVGTPSPRGCVFIWILCEALSHGASFGQSTLTDV